MLRVILALAAILITAPEPPPETEYILRFEEHGCKYDYPFLLGACYESLHHPDEELISRIEVKLQLGRPFHIKLRQSDVIRELQGTVVVNNEHRLALTLAYSSKHEVPDENGIVRKDNSATSVTNVQLEIGKQVAMGGMISFGTYFYPTETVLKGHRLSFKAVLLPAKPPL